MWLLSVGRSRRHPISHACRPLGRYGLCDKLTGSDSLYWSDKIMSSLYTSGSQSGRYRPLGGGGITEVGANRYEGWKGALLLSQGVASRQVAHLFL